MYTAVKSSFSQPIVLTTNPNPNPVSTAQVVTAANATANNSLYATVTGTTNGNDQKIPEHKGIKVFINILNIATAGTLTVTIQGKDPVSGNYYTILATTALNSMGFTVLTVYPGATVAANVAASDVLPDTIRIQAVVGGTVTGTFIATIAGCLIP